MDYGHRFHKFPYKKKYQKFIKQQTTSIYRNHACPDKFFSTTKQMEKIETMRKRQRERDENLLMKKET